jgi:hypothetical protein
MLRLRLIPLLLVLATAAVHAEEQSPPSASPAKEAPKEPFYLITDYLPQAIYDADSVTGCFRVENTTGKEDNLELAIKVSDASGAVVEELNKPIVAPNSGFGQCQYTQDIRKAASVHFTLKKGATKYGEVNVRLIRDDVPWPDTKIVNGRVVATDNGDVVVPVVHRVLKVQNRAFAPIKWIIGDSAKEQKAKGEQAVIFVPGRWPLNAAAHTQSNQKWIVLGPYAADGSMPALRAFDQVIRELTPKGGGGGPLANPPRVAICLPPEDLGVASDPRVYRMVVDALQARLIALGIKQIVLIPPFQFGTPDKYWQRMNSEVQESASVYGMQAVDPTEFLGEKLWRVDPEVEGAYGASPNPAGLKKIEQGLADLLP